MILRIFHIFFIFFYILNQIATLVANNNIEYITTWTKHCFKILPEFSKREEKTSCSSITKKELTLLYSEFRKNISQSPLQNKNEWINQKKSPSIKNSGPLYGTFNEQYTHDLKSQFVQKIEVLEGSSLYFFGDLHGSIHALLRNLLRLERKGILNNSWKIYSKDTYLIFLGDFIDHGAYGLECWATLMKLFNENPTKVLLLRGNHESANHWSWGGFQEEALRKNYTEFLPHFNDFCRKLPIALFLKSGKAIVQCCHGGIEPAFNPRQLLTSTQCHYQQVTKHFNISQWKGPQSTTQHLSFYGAGFNHSSFTGCYKKNDINPIVSINGFLWHTNETIYGSNKKNPALCYVTDITETNHYLQLFGLSGFFRGHDDTHSSFKLIKKGIFLPTQWSAILSQKKYSLNFLKTIGIPMQYFLNNPDTVPVFTFTTATEARSLPNEGFGVVTTAKNFADWKIKPHIFIIPKRTSASFVSAHLNANEVNFFWHQQPQQNPITYKTRASVINKKIKQFFIQITVLLKKINNNCTHTLKQYIFTKKESSL